MNRSEFRVSLLLTFFHIKVKDSSLLDYLPMAGRGTAAFIPFLRALAQCEMKTSPFASHKSEDVSLADTIRRPLLVSLILHGIP